MKKYEAGKGEHAGLPSQVKMTAYPRVDCGRDGQLNDTISGVDADYSQADRLRKSKISYQK